FWKLILFAQHPSRRLRLFEACAGVLSKYCAQAIRDFAQASVGLNSTNDSRHQVLIGASRLLNLLECFSHRALVAARANAIEPFNLLPLELRIQAKQGHRNAF